MKKSLLSLSLVASLISVSHVQAGTWCSETVEDIIIHKDGNVYFTTDKTCNNNWCLIPGDETNKNRGLTTMLTAQMAEHSITFHWRGIDSCNESNTSYATPEYFTLNLGE